MHKGSVMREAKAANRRIRVDRIKCDGHGLCAEILPEVIRLDDWGYPIIDGDSPGELLDLARRAAAACPVRALFLEP